MKKVVVTLLMVVVAQLAMSQDIIFKKYEDAKGVQTVYLSKTLLSLAAGSLDDVEDMDLRSIAGKLDNLRILDCEKAGMAAKIKVDALAAFKNGRYEEMMRVNDGDEKTFIYFRKNGKKNEFALLNIERDEVQLINIIGTMTLEDIKRCMK